MSNKEKMSQGNLLLPVPETFKGGGSFNTLQIPVKPAEPPMRSMLSNLSAVEVGDGFQKLSRLPSYQGRTPMNQSHHSAVTASDSPAGLIQQGTVGLKGNE